MSTTKPQTIKITDGSTVNYQVPLHPDMLKDSGYKHKTSLPNVTLQLGREYVISKLKKEFIDLLHIKSNDDLTLLLSATIK